MKLEEYLKTLEEYEEKYGERYGIDFQVKQRALEISINDFYGTPGNMEWLNDSPQRKQFLDLLYARFTDSLTGIDWSDLDSDFCDDAVEPAIKKNQEAGTQFIDFIRILEGYRLITLKECNTLETKVNHLLGEMLSEAKKHGISITR